MNEEPYKNREIREMFDDVKITLSRIEEQTIQTNGRVSKLERATWILGTIAFMLIATKPELVKLLFSLI